MPVTMRLMALGNWSVQWKPDAPASIRNLCTFDGAGVIPVAYDTLVITPTRKRPVTQFPDATLLSRAIFHGVITKADPLTGMSGSDLSWFMGDGNGIGARPSTSSAGPWADLSVAFAAIVPSTGGGIAVGTVNTAGLAALTNKVFPLTCTVREQVIAACAGAGAEWRMNPTGTIDAATAANLFVGAAGSGTKVLITRRASGFETTLRGMGESQLQIARDIEQFTSGCIAVNGPDGTQWGVSTPFSDGSGPIDGSGVNRTRFVDASGQNATDAGVTATSITTQYGAVRSQVTITSDTHNVGLFSQPGDWVYVYDPTIGLKDDTQNVAWRGQRISPSLQRVYGITWPIEPRMGIYHRSFSSGSLVTTDITDYVQIEDSPVSWEIGSTDSTLSNTTVSTLGSDARFGANYQATRTATGGLLGRHSLTTAFTTTGTHTTYQDEGLTATVNDAVGRTYRWTLTVNPKTSGAVNGIYYELLRDGASIRTWYLGSQAMSTTETISLTLMHTEVIAATHSGSVYKVRIKAATNTAVDSYGDAIQFRQLTIEDIT